MGPVRGRRRDHAVERAADARHLADRAGARRRRTPWSLKPPEWAPLTARCSPTSRARRACPTARSTSCRGSARRPAPRSSRTPTSIGSRSPARSRPASSWPRRPARTSRRSRSSSGGKSPFVAFADADLDAVVQQAVNQFDNAGQVCLAGHAAARRGRDLRRVPRAVHRGGRRRSGRATRARRRPTSARRSRASTSSGSTASCSARRPTGAEVVFGGGPNEELGRPVLPADAVPRRRPRASEILQRGGVRPGAHAAALRRRGRGRRARERHRRTAWRRSCTRATATRAERVSARARRRHRLGQLLLRARPGRARSAARGTRGSAARAASGASTSTRT